jgi:hypothetical protein
MHSPRLRAIALIVSALIGTVACGGSDGRSPAGPTPTESGNPAAPAPVTGATITGTVTAGVVAEVRSLDTGLAGVKISVSGTDLSTTTGAGGGFQLRAVPPGLVRLLFETPGASGSLDLADVSQTEEISLSVVVSASTIELAAEARVNGSQAQLEGKVVGANYTARTLVVGATTVVVPADAPITNGFRELELEDVIVGARIHVKGSAATGTTITATSIIVQQTGLERVTVSGEVSDMAGACPDVTFKFGSLVLAVNGSTIFVQGTCGDLEGGVTVEVKGIRRTDGSVLGTMVKFKSGGNGNPEKTVELSGVVSGLSGSCPARRFQLAGREIKTTGATTFLTPCGSLTNGQTVEVKGKETGDGKVNASQVK